MLYYNVPLTGGQNLLGGVFSRGYSEQGYTRSPKTQNPSGSRIMTKKKQENKISFLLRGT